MRPATPAEEAAFHAALDGLERGLAARMVGDLALAITQRDHREWVALVSPDVLRLPEALRERASAAVPIGTLDAEGFALGLQGAVLLARFTEKGTVRVNEKAARLFIYGRNILAQSVLRADHALRVGDHCVVCNPRNEGLGTGVVVGRFKGDGEAVHPLHDLGAYLREEGLGPGDEVEE